MPSFYKKLYIERKKQAVYTPADSPFVLQITSPIFLYTSKRDIFMA